MMNVMERGGERLKGMAQPCVDHVLNERPCEHSRDETGNAGNHTQQFYPARNRLTTRKKAHWFSLISEISPSGFSKGGQPEGAPRDEKDQ
jgi:hypothetical protein